MNEDKKIVGIGYNGMPNGCSDDALPWNREADSKLHTKYPYGTLNDTMQSTYYSMVTGLLVDTTCQHLMAKIQCYMTTHVRK